MPSYYTTIRTQSGDMLQGWAMYARDGEDARRKVVALARNVPVELIGDGAVVVTRRVPFTELENIEHYFKS